MTSRESQQTNIRTDNVKTNQPTPFGETFSLLSDEWQVCGYSEFPRFEDAGRLLNALEKFGVVFLFILQGGCKSCRLQSLEFD